LVEVAHRLARREPVAQITDVRGTAFVRRADDASAGEWTEIDASEVDQPGRMEERMNPYQPTAQQSVISFPRLRGKAGMGAAAVIEATTPAPRTPSPYPLPQGGEGKDCACAPAPPHAQPKRARTVIRLPSYEQVKSDPVLYAHASRVLHQETNPGNARALVQAHGQGATAKDVWINPPPIPLTTPEIDWVFGLPYARSPHPAYADARGRHDGATKIPAWEMIRFSVNIMRGCFGGCTFCSITEHEGRIIQSRSEASVIAEIEAIRDHAAGFTGVISDLGGPTANMYRLGCKSRAIEAVCRKPSCVYPAICGNLVTDHAPLIALYRHARKLPGIKKILSGSGLRYDLAVRSPEYVRELATHHVGGYLKIAPEHTEAGPLSKMMKPGIAAYDRFKALFDQASQAAGKEQFLIPYFIAAHPGTTDEDMLQLALWLKAHGLRADQVQAFYPSPMATATAMYPTGLNPLAGIHRDTRAERVETAKGERRRRLHKAFLRWHDPANWPLLRQALKRMGRADLIGNGKRHLIPAWQPATDGRTGSARRKNTTPPSGAGKNKSTAQGRILTQHTGLPPRGRQ
jgi:uncharacterized radical SAM protein YgiQ